MHRVTLLIVVATLVLVGCKPDAQKTLATCEGASDVFILPDLDGSPPPGAGQQVHLARIEGDDHCYMIDQFAHVSGPDACGSDHYHGDKTAIGGYVRKDTKPHECGAATAPEVTDFIAYRYDPESMSSSSASVAYGHKEGEVCNCTPSAPCCGPNVTSQYHGVLEKIVDDWNDWDATERKNRCETIVDVEYSSDSWDIREFYDAEVVGWASPGCKEGTCQRTVQIAGVCWVDMVANYAMWGVMTKLCEDISVGPYDRVMLDGAAKWAWTRVVSPIMYGDNPHKEGQDGMAQAGYDATQKFKGEWVFRSVKFDEFMKAQASKSITNSCGQCDHPNLTPVPSEFHYRWRNEG